MKAIKWLAEVCLQCIILAMFVLIAGSYYGIASKQDIKDSEQRMNERYNHLSDTTGFIYTGIMEYVGMIKPEPKYPRIFVDSNTEEFLRNNGCIISLEPSCAYDVPLGGE